MTATEFLVYLDHFIKHVKPSPTDSVLLLLDNHFSHIDIQIIDKAKSNGVIMLSFPPHCTHCLLLWMSEYMAPLNITVHLLQLIIGYGTRTDHENL